MCSTQQRNQLVGRRTRRVIRLGDKLTVQVAKVDTFKKQVDFRLAVKAGDARAMPGKMPRGPKRFSVHRSSRRPDGR